VRSESCKRISPVRDGPKVTDAIQLVSCAHATNNRTREPQSRTQPEQETRLSIYVHHMARRNLQMCPLVDVREIFRVLVCLSVYEVWIERSRSNGLGQFSIVPICRKLSLGVHGFHSALFKEGLPETGAVPRVRLWQKGCRRHSPHAFVF
jgi:hypothetical protein